MTGAPALVGLGINQGSGVVVAPVGKVVSRTTSTIGQAGGSGTTGILAGSPAEEVNPSAVASYVMICYKERSGFYNIVAGDVIVPLVLGKTKARSV